MRKFIDTFSVRLRNVLQARAKEEGVDISTDVRFMEWLHSKTEEELLLVPKFTRGSLAELRTRLAERPLPETPVIPQGEPMEVTDQRLLRLKERWEIVVVTEVNGRWMCCDHTDEGIGGRMSFTADTPSRAVAYAYEYVFNGRRDPEYVGHPEIGE